MKRGFWARKLPGEGGSKKGCTKKPGEGGSKKRCAKKPGDLCLGCESVHPNFRKFGLLGLASQNIAIANLLRFQTSADCKRGRKKGAVRKLSKSVEKLFDTF